MLAAINLDDQLLLETNEIYYVRPDGLLTAKFAAADLIAAEMLLQSPLGIGRIFPENPGSVGAPTIHDCRPSHCIQCMTQLKGGILSPGGRGLR